MSIKITNPSYLISASATSSQRVQITNGQQCRFIRVVNGHATGHCFVNAGGSTVAATSSNMSVGPLQTRSFERDPNTDTYVAALVSTTTATISVAPVNEDSADNKG